MPACGVLRGYLDVATRDRVAGWAFDEARPHSAVRLSVLDNGVAVMELVANGYRQDLEQAGLGSGRHGFDVRVPGGLPPAQRHCVVVQRTEDGAALANTPIMFEAAGAFDEALEKQVDEAIGAAGASGHEHRILGFLATQAERVKVLHAGLAAVPATASGRALVLLDDSELTEQARMFALLQRLDYHVCVVAPDRLDGSSAEFGASDVTVCAAPFFSSTEEVLRRGPGPFEVIVVMGLANASRYLALARHYQPRARIVLTALQLERGAAACAAAGAADAILVCGAEDATWLRGAVPRAQVHLLAEGWQDAVQGAAELRTANR